MDGFQILRCLWKCLDKILNLLFKNFQKLKIKLKKGPLKFQKIKNKYKEASNQKVL